MSNTVDHPPHYQHPSGVKAIDICEHLGFNLGNAYKYLARAGKKGDRAEDLRKAAWYLRRHASRKRDGGRGGAAVFVTPDVRAMANKVFAAGADGDAFRMMLLAIGDGWVHDTDCFAIANECDHEAAS